MCNAVAALIIISLAGAFGKRWARVCACTRHACTLCRMYIAHTRHAHCAACKPLTLTCSLRAYTVTCIYSKVAQQAQDGHCDGAGRRVAAGRHRRHRRLWSGDSAAAVLPTQRAGPSILLYTHHERLALWSPDPIALTLTLGSPNPSPNLSPDPNPRASCARLWRTSWRRSSTRRRKHITYSARAPDYSRPQVDLR